MQARGARWTFSLRKAPFISPMQKISPLIPPMFNRAEFLLRLLQFGESQIAQTPHAFLANAEFARWGDQSAMRRIFEPAILRKTTRMFF